MTTRSSLSPFDLAVDAVHYTFRAVPITCFSMALLTDIAYWQTSNLLWLHFSEWLLLAGVVFVGLSLLVAGLDLLFRRVRPTWPAVFLGLVIFVIATINNLVHTADGWTAVVPWGLILSAATVLLMILTGWFNRRGDRHA